MPRTKMHILDTELGTHVFLTVLKQGKTTPYEIAKKIGYVNRYELKNGTVKEVVRPQKLYSIIKELEKENVVISKKDREGRIKRTVEVNWSGLVDLINQYLTEKLTEQEKQVVLEFLKKQDWKKVFETEIQHSELSSLFQEIPKPRGVVSFKIYFFGLLLGWLSYFAYNTKKNMKQGSSKKTLYKKAETVFPETFWFIFEFLKLPENVLTKLSELRKLCPLELNSQLELVFNAINYQQKLIMKFLTHI